MIKLPRRGFTIIEILVVIAIVAVLSAVATIGYGKVAAQMRDKQREAHVATILSLLENYYKNFNEYPPACSGINYDAATKTCISTGSAPYMYNSGKALNMASFADASTILSGLGDSVRDPNVTSIGPLGPFNTTYASSTKLKTTYLYTGGMYYGSAGSGSYIPYSIGLAGYLCNYNFPFSTGSVTAGTVVYYSEAEDLIIFKSTSKGKKPTVNTSLGTPANKCVAR
jgi:prepilin-type N-terminal cleavage/methylation domain-containing protein